MRNLSELLHLVHPVNEYAARQNMLAGLKVETVFS